MALETRGYEVLKVVGKGAFGQALLVRHQSSSVAFVAKEIDMTNMSKRDIDGSRNEVAVLAQLDHPNITKFIESFEHGNKIYIIMEYADGGDLATKIKKQKRELRKPFSEEQILTYFIQVCLALKHLHKKHILHRDLKTMNVFLTSSDVVKLGDFGVSKQLGTVGLANTVCGTPYYFSPEMCRNEPYSSKCDVWSLGVMLYELIMLTKPFQAKDIKSLMQVIATGVYHPINDKLGHSEELRELTRSLLNLDPAQRPNIPTIMSSPYMQRNLKNFARAIREKEAAQANLAKQHKKPTPSPTAPTPAPAPQASMKLGKVNKTNIAAMVNAPPPEYMQDLKRNQEAGSPKAGSPKPNTQLLTGHGLPGCRPNFEKTISDCADMVKLVAVAHDNDGGGLLTDKAPVTTKAQLQELLHQRVGPEKLRMCIDIYNSFDHAEGEDTELLKRLQGVLGPQALQITPLIEQYIFQEK
eukprot:TRINITY_DN6599_c1_g1_i1.p1 TRINITY_DN6599_c1_g1~~TRINITY_DN6599_c1_g1_i1.p1  ORF type:complete len:468 (+),score=90.97 TRINITY_DN6599_c1_g1_i1:53-1456(+)